MIAASSVTAIKAMSWSVGGGSVNVEDEQHPAIMCPVMRDLTQRGKKRSLHKVGINEACHDDSIEDAFNLAEKKRGLTIEQINFLETSFSIDVKLEPERKVLIAKQLGIRPRQVAIWFQNRRARWKNKQLEQDYETLKASYDAVLKEKESILKEHDATLKRNKALQAETSHLRSLLESSECGSISNDICVGLKEAWQTKEHSSSKAEVMSPTKSVVDQSEMQDSERSFPTLSETIKVLTKDPSVEEIDCDFRPQGEIPSIESIFGSLPLMVQQLMVTGYSLEDAYNRFFEWEDQFGGLAMV